MTVDVQTALANEARRGELKQKVAKYTGIVEASASLQQRIMTVNNDNLILLNEAQAELAAMEAGAGPGVTADYGPKSVISQLLETERFAAKDAVIDFVKANPECTEEAADEVWEEAALASHPSFPLVLQDGLVFSALYRANLLAGNYIAENTWAAHRQFILNTPKDVLTKM